MQVVRRKLAGQDFVWLIPGWFGPNWWAAVDGTDCTAEEMKKSLEHTLEGLAIGLFDYDPDRVLVSKKVTTASKHKTATLVFYNNDYFLDCCTFSRRSKEKI